MVQMLLKTFKRISLTIRTTAKLPRKPMTLMVILAFLTAMPGGLNWGQVQFFQPKFTFVGFWAVDLQPNSKTSYKKYYSSLQCNNKVQSYYHKGLSFSAGHNFFPLIDCQCLLLAPSFQDILSTLSNHIYIVWYWDCSAMYLSDPWNRDPSIGQRTHNRKWHPQLWQTNLCQCQG